MANILTLLILQQSHKVDIVIISMPILQMRRLKEISVLKVVSGRAWIWHSSSEPTLGTTTILCIEP